MSEECGLEAGPLRAIGYQRVRLLGPPPPHYRYPHPDSVLAFFAGRVSMRRLCPSNAETRGRGIFTPSDAEAQHWMRQNHDLYRIAREALRRANAPYR